MQLPDNRTGAYLRALTTALEVLAPHDDFVPLSEATAHLRALSPEVSGPLLLPAEVEPVSGLPAFAWLGRAIAEQYVAVQGSDATDTSEQDIARAQRLEPELGERLAGRRRLHRFLRKHPLMPNSRLIGARRRLNPITLTFSYDQIGADGLWSRLRVDLAHPSPTLYTVESDGGVRCADSVLHLLHRHARTPLLGLVEQIEAGMGGRIARLSRCHVGPFWFPGIPLPAGAPPGLNQGLVLNLASELVGAEVLESRHLDPLRSEDLRGLREGLGVYRQRRFAATPAQAEMLREWGEGLDMDLLVSVFAR